MTQLIRIEPPAPGRIPSDPKDFIEELGQPCYMLLPGADRTRVRALVTLIHGNEPSGFYSVHQWLRSGRQPAVDTLLILPSVSAALMSPVFSTRMPPGQRDLNRCFFDATCDDDQGRLAQQVLQLLRIFHPEAVVDIHNTSGSGPGFGVVIREDRLHSALVSLFASRMIVTDLRLGALMEISEAECPTVTVESGGRLDEAAHELAWQGLQNYLQTEQLFADRGSVAQLDVYHNPVRLELNAGRTVAVSDTAIADVALTLPTDVEKFNYGKITQEQRLCWLGDDLHKVLRANNHRGEDCLDSLFVSRDGGLYPARDLKLFMFTNNPTIARSDCVLYASGYGDAPLNRNKL